MTTEHTPAAWTEDETAAFTQALMTFRDSLPPRQHEAFAAILKAATEAAGDEDVQGYFLLSPNGLLNLQPSREPYHSPPGYKLRGGSLYPVGTRTDEAR